MRAIDADGVSEILTRVIEEQKKSHHVDELIGLMEARTEVNNAPTLDVKPVVHAHWIPECPNKRNKKAYRHTCSECGRTVYDARQVSIDEMGYAFCPHCGAKMDEEEGQ